MQIGLSVFMCLYFKGQQNYANLCMCKSKIYLCDLSFGLYMFGGVYLFEFSCNRLFFFI